MHICMKHKWSIEGGELQWFNRLGFSRWGTLIRFLRLLQKWNKLSHTVCGGSARVEEQWVLAIDRMSGWARWGESTLPPVDSQTASLPPPPPSSYQWPFFQLTKPDQLTTIDFPTNDPIQVICEATHENSGWSIKSMKWQVTGDKGYDSWQLISINGHIKSIN